VIVIYYISSMCAWSFKLWMRIFWMEYRWRPVIENTRISLRYFLVSLSKLLISAITIWKINSICQWSSNYVRLGGFLANSLKNPRLVCWVYVSLFVEETRTTMKIMRQVNDLFGLQWHNNKKNVTLDKCMNNMQGLI